MTESDFLQQWTPEARAALTGLQPPADRGPAARGIQAGEESQPAQTIVDPESIAPRPGLNPFTYITRFGRSPTGRTIRVSEEEPGLAIYVVRYTPDNPSTPIFNYAKPYGLGEWRTPWDNTPEWARVENSNFPPTPNQWVNEPKSGQLLVQRFGTDDRVLGFVRAREVMLRCQEIFNENDANRPVRLIGYGIKEPGRVEPWILEEYVSEEDNFKELEKYLDDKRGIRLEQIEAIRIIIGVMEVIAKMHKAGIILGDMIQESNIFWDPKGQRIRVVDFESAGIEGDRSYGITYGLDNKRIAQLFYYLVSGKNIMMWSDEEVQNAIKSLRQDPVVEIMKQAFTLDRHDKEGSFKMYQELRGKAELFGIVLPPTDEELREKAIREARENLEDRVRRFIEWRQQPGHENGGFNEWLELNDLVEFRKRVISPSDLIDARVTSKDLERYKTLLDTDYYGYLAGNLSLIVERSKETNVVPGVKVQATDGSIRMISTPEDEKWRDELIEYLERSRGVALEQKVTDEERKRQLDEAIVKLGSLAPNNEEERMEIVKNLPSLIPAEWDPEGPEMRTILRNIVPDEIDVFTKAMIEMIEKQRTQ